MGTASGNAVSSTDPSSAATGSATSTTGVDPDNPGTAANQQGTASATSGGIAGIAAEAGRRRNADPRCRDVLAHKDYFTAQVVLNCQAQVGGTTGTATDRRDLPTGSLGSGLKPIDRPAEVQRGKEVSDNKAVKGICSNC